MIESAMQMGKRGMVKCVVWDLDGTLWKGVLLEDEHVSLHAQVAAVVAELDQRGILQSIASRNDYAAAMEKLKNWELDHYFLYPQINWNSKVSSIQTIAQSLNIGLDSIAFVDDQPFERDEVTFSLPQVLCIDAVHIGLMLDMDALRPRQITEDASKRRLLYQNEMRRTLAEDEFVGSRDEFLASLQLVLTISPAREEDLARAEELTVRTHQLNTTGYTYSVEELNTLRVDPNYRLLLASLDDIYGSYGKIGLSLVECKSDVWIIKLLLMSCRVANRGIGSVFINYLLHLASEQGVSVLAEFIPNGRNRMMYVTYKFAGFQEQQQIGDVTILENNLSHLQAFPDYVQIQADF